MSFFVLTKNRWHADIKPDNILIIEKEDSSGIITEEFKLADPGFAKFVLNTGKDSEVVLTGGTRTCGKRGILHTSWWQRI